MSEKELLEIIHKSVCESIEKNKEEFFKKFNFLSTCLTSQASPSDIQQALFDYTTFVSESNCIAMAKILISMGILNISSSSD